MRVMTWILAAGLAVAATASGKEADDKLQRVAEHLQRIEALGFSGTVAVRLPGQPDFVRGYGLVREKPDVPADADSVYSIGSITKQFTAAAILLLEQRGKLAVTDPAGKYLPELPEGQRGTTLHQLLTHSAGYPGALGDDREPVDTAAFLALVAKAPLAGKPGTYRYSNVGYSLLGIIVERVSGQDYEAFLRENLFLPAGMAQTGYRLPDWSKATVANGFRNGEDRGSPNRYEAWVDSGPYWHLKANGGLLSTAADMLRWHDALRGGAILDAGQRRKLTTRHIAEGEGADSHYGYGWALFTTPRGTNLVTHNGGNGVFFADFLRYVDEGIVIYVACNRDGPRWRDTAGDIAGLLLRPGFEPRLPVPAVQLADFPDTPVGKAAREIFAAIKAGGEVGLKQLVEQHFDQGFAGMVPLDRHLAVLGRIHGRVATARLVGVSVSGEGVQVQVQPAEGGPLTLRIDLTPVAPHRVAGMAVMD